MTLKKRSYARLVESKEIFEILKETQALLQVASERLAKLKSV